METTIPRQRLAPGEHGKITNSSHGGIHYATTYVRLHTGQLRERVASSSKSAEDARRVLKRRIQIELDTGTTTDGALSHKATLSKLFEVWIAAKLSEDGIKDQTASGYRDTWRRHAEQQIGALRIAELSTSRADAYLKMLSPWVGANLRVILTGMFNLAARFDAVRTNPIRETRTAKPQTVDAKALTTLEFEEVRQAVKAFCDRKGPGPRRAPMLPAYVELLAATGARPGEVLGLRWEDVDLLADPPTITITGTVIDHGRAAGAPLHRQEARKLDAPAHTVTLPAFGVQVLTELFSVTGPAGPVLTNRGGGLVSPSNIRSSLREALVAHEHLQWVTPKSFRKTTATVVRDGLGVEAAQRQLSHKQLATTEKHYVQRVTSGPDARDVLDRWASNED